MFNQVVRLDGTGIIARKTSAGSQINPAAYTALCTFKIRLKYLCSVEILDDEIRWLSQFLATSQMEKSDAGQERSF